MEPPGHAPLEFAAQLREILDPDPKLDLVSGPVSGVLQLRDPKSGMTFDVRGLSDEAVAIRVETIQHVKALASKDDLRLVCDYLLVERAPGNTGLLVVLLELKTTIGYDSRPREQLRRSLPILRYLQSACEVHFRKTVAFEEKYILVGSAFHPSFDKQPVTFTGRQSLFENHRGITIKILVGCGESFGALVA